VVKVAGESGELDMARASFPGLEQWAYLDFGGVSLLPMQAVKATQRIVENTAHMGILASGEGAAEVERVRALAASFVGATAGEICFVRHTTEGLGWVANGLGLGEGDRVIVSGNEFPSSFFPWLTLADLGTRVDVVPAEDLRWPIERFAAALADGPPAVVLAVSWVQFSTGWRTDLEELGRLCREYGTLLCVDMIQGCGVLPLDLQALPVDFAVADGHKWLCGPEGAGIMYIASSQIPRLRPLEPGWNSVSHRTEWDNLAWVPDASARRFEGGSQNTIGIAALGASLDLLTAVGIEKIWQRVESLTDFAAARLLEKDMRIVSDRSAAQKSGILTFAHPSRSPQDIVHAAREAGVVVSGPRGGGVRLSPHAWNQEEDIERLLLCL